MKKQNRYAQGMARRLMLAGLSLSILMQGRAGLSAEGEEIRIPVVPYPQVVEPGKGYFSSGGPSLSIMISGLGEETSGIVLDQLSEAFEGFRGERPELSVGGKADIWIGLPETDQALQALAAKKGLVPGQELGNEGYLLKIEKRNIYVTANSEAGAFYGVQTLRQLLRGYAATGHLNFDALAAVARQPSIP